jgi:predicted  nucleic acid-binding Zn-ribbon protein
MESICIRCGSSFETDSWDLDLCPECEIELSELEKDEQRGYELKESGEWDDDD